MTRKIPELDGLRALAVLPVIAFHFTYLRYVVGGYLGVDLFFVLSGFLITSLLLSEQDRTGTVSLRDFYARRALRILPPLAACVVLALATVPSTTPLGALAAMFFAANMVDSRILGGLLHTWSIAVEEHFYFAWPMLFLALGSKRSRFLGWTILVVLAVRIVVLSMKMDVYTPTYTRADSLAVGCCAALAMARGKPRWGAWVAPAALAVVAALLAFTPWMFFPMLSFGFTLFAALCAVLIVAALSSKGIANRILSSAPLQYVGRRSYGLYLYHMPVFLALERFRTEDDAASMALVTLLRVALTFAIAEISYRTIEAWAARYKSRFRPDARWAGQVMGEAATSPRS
jgi:peptidoglycan/LPS O-acetylase OafA/YrhL